MDIEVKSVKLGFMDVNCYLVSDKKTGDCLIVDPGFPGERLDSFLKDNGVEKLRYILLTHGHFDHISGAETVKRKYGGSVVISREDSPCLKDNNLSLGASFPKIDGALETTADILVKDGDALQFADGEIKVIATPGHSVGSVCYFIDDVMFSGDTLFKGSIGRTDFITSNSADMVASLKKIKDLKGQFLVCTGHGECTDLDEEKANNPYLNLN